MNRFFVFIAVLLMITSCQYKKRDAQGYYERGMNKVSKENYKQALQDFTKAIELDKNFVDAYFARAFYVREKTGDFIGAIEDYTRAIELKNSDNDAKAYSNRGHAKFMLKEYKEAISDIQAALSLDPNDPYTYRNRALIFIQIDNKPMICQDLKKALDLGYTKLYDDEVERLFHQYCNEDGTLK
jgi:tetratricopeptide (TPR) repeat protein